MLIMRVVMKLWKDMVCILKCYHSTGFCSFSTHRPNAMFSVYFIILA